MKIIPKPGELVHQALLVIGGAVLAAVLIAQFPQLRTWIESQWGKAPK